MEANSCCYAWPKDSLCNYTHSQCNGNQPTLFLRSSQHHLLPLSLEKMAASSLTAPATSLLFPTVSSSKSPLFPHFLPSTRRRFSTHVFSTEILGYTFTLDDQTALLPVLSPGLSQFQKTFEQLPEAQRWVLAVFGGLIWIYLTARPGVLLGAIDAYLLAPLQLVLDRLTGRRSLKMTDFAVGNKLGEGSFGVVYSGAIVPKDWNGEEMGRMKGRSLESDKKIKERVILKKVCV